MVYDDVLVHDSPLDEVAYWRCRLFARTLGVNARLSVGDIQSEVSAHIGIPRSHSI